MAITFDPAKRNTTLAKRGLDFAEAVEVFAGFTHTVEDDRFDYGETRWITYGLLRGRLIAIGLDRTGSRPTHHFDEEVQ